MGKKQSLETSIIDPERLFNSFKSESTWEMRQEENELRASLDYTVKLKSVCY